MPFLQNNRTAETKKNIYIMSLGLKSILHTFFLVDQFRTGVRFSPKKKIKSMCIIHAMQKYFIFLHTFFLLLF